MVHQAHGLWHQGRIPSEAAYKIYNIGFVYFAPAQYTYRYVVLPLNMMMGSMYCTCHY